MNFAALENGQAGMAVMSNGLREFEVIANQTEQRDTFVLTLFRGIGVLKKAEDEDALSCVFITLLKQLQSLVRLRLQQRLQSGLKPCWMKHQKLMWLYKKRRSLVH